MTEIVGGSDEVHGGTARRMSIPRVGVLDRDSGFLTVLANRVEHHKWEHRILSGTVDVEAIASMKLSALVVDLALLGPQAWDWLARLASAIPDCAILVCTGTSTVGQRVRGLRLGADDWITKPCHPEEVIARIETAVRRRRRVTAKSETVTVTAGELQIRPDRFQAYVRGQSLDLTRREFELIELLASVQGRVLEREEIYSRLWGYAMVRGDRSVDVFVRKVRGKLEKASPNWCYIHTHFGIGYRFAAKAIAVEALLSGDLPGIDSPTSTTDSPRDPSTSSLRQRRLTSASGRDESEVARRDEQEQLAAATAG